MSTGLGFNISVLSGNEKSFNTLQEAKGSVIESARIDDDALRLKMQDGRTLILYDDAQSCCEARHMSTDDDLESLAGATFMGIDLVESKQQNDQEDEYGEVHERLFLDLLTSIGVFTLVSHNEHNGYYGGIMPRFKWEQS